MIPLQRGLSAVRTTATIGPRFSVFLYYIHVLRLLSEVRARSKITSHFGSRCIPAGCVAKTRNIQIFLRFSALPARRLNAQKGELISSRTLSRWISHERMYIVFSNATSWHVKDGRLAGILQNKNRTKASLYFNPGNERSVWKQFCNPTPCILKRKASGRG